MNCYICKKELNNDNNPKNIDVKTKLCYTCRKSNIFITRTDAKKTYGLTDSDLLNLFSYQMTSFKYIKEGQTITLFVRQEVKDFSEKKFIKIHENTKKIIKIEIPEETKALPKIVFEREIAKERKTIVDDYFKKHNFIPKYDNKLNNFIDYGLLNKKNSKVKNADFLRKEQEITLKIEK
jgi:hypothetical protein